jgi:hypothetical protein
MKTPIQKVRPDNPTKKARGKQKQTFAHTETTENLLDKDDFGGEQSL